MERAAFGTTGGLLALACGLPVFVGTGGGPPDTFVAAAATVPGFFGIVGGPPRFLGTAGWVEPARGPLGGIVGATAFLSAAAAAPGTWRPSFLSSGSSSPSRACTVGSFEESAVWTFSEAFPDASTACISSSACL
jgi:hypothetical protein